MIWALAIGQVRRFQTREAKNELSKRGFEIVQILNYDNFEKSTESFER